MATADNAAWLRKVRSAAAGRGLFVGRSPLGVIDRSEPAGARQTRVLATGLGAPAVYEAVV